MADPSSVLLPQNPPWPQPPLNTVLGGMVTKYKSAVDWWFYAVIVFTFVVLGFVTFQMFLVDSQLGLFVVAGTSILGLGLPLWLFFGTYYVISKDEIHIRSGPLSWRIKRSSIQGVERTNSPLSSPALSFNRLIIRYGDNQSIMISPVSQDDFLTDLQLPPNV